MYLAIDLGGTKTLIGLLDDSGKLVNSIKFPTPTDYRQFLVELESNTRSFIQNIEIKAVCMAIPGTIDRENGIIEKLGNLSWGENIKIKQDISKFLPYPTAIENDANLAGLSEAIAVKANYSKALYITISTGIGGVFVINGEFDKDTIDAEIGHMVFEHNGKVVEWEDMASGKWIVETYGKRASELEDETAWRNISKNIAIGIVNLSTTLTPDVIIIGGGVGTHLDKFKHLLDDEISKIDTKFVDIPTIIKASHPEEAVIYGCYELAKRIG